MGEVWRLRGVVQLQQEAAARSSGTAGPSAQDASMEQIEMSDWPIRVLGRPCG